MFGDKIELANICFDLCLAADTLQKQHICFCAYTHYTDDMTFESQKRTDYYFTYEKSIEVNFSVLFQRRYFSRKIR